jgi:hypothetical protein
MEHEGFQSLLVSLRCRKRKLTPNVGGFLRKPFASTNCHFPFPTPHCRWTKALHQDRISESLSTWVICSRVQTFDPFVHADRPIHIPLPSFELEGYRASKSWKRWTACIHGSRKSLQASCTTGSRSRVDEVF